MFTKIFLKIFNIRYYRIKNKYKHISLTNTEQIRLFNDFVFEASIETLPKAKVVHVIDGDTVIVLSNWTEIKVRLDSIDCPEDGQHWGDVAKYALIKMIGGRHVRMESHGVDIHGRLLSTLYIWNKSKNEWTNINERMVTLGHAWVMRMYYGHLSEERKRTLNRLEKWAKSKNKGLWNYSDSVPPWEWRKNEEGSI